MIDCFWGWLCGGCDWVEVLEIDDLFDCGIECVVGCCGDG